MKHLAVYGDPFLKYLIKYQCRVIYNVDLKCLKLLFMHIGYYNSCGLTATDKYMCDY